MKRPGYDGDCWPDELQTALLRVALCDADTARREWAGLRDHLVLDDVWDVEIHRLLPLVRHNLAAAGVDDADFPRMRGIRGSRNRVALFAEDLVEQLANVRFVVDDQNLGH